MLDSRGQESDIAAMRRLMLLRHAKTERPEPGQRDRDRKLTKRGHGDAPLIGAYMAKHGLIPDLALVSPATRAQESWALIVPELGKKSKVRDDERVYNATWEKLIAVIAETRAAHSLLVVGHNPSLHDLALQLIASGDIAARERVTEKLPTSGLVVIDLAFDDWSRLRPHAGRLERFVSPKLLAEATE